MGPYSQAMVVKGVVFTSGQTPLNPETGEIQGATIEEQAEQVMKGLGAVLKDRKQLRKDYKNHLFFSRYGRFRSI